VESSGIISLEVVLAMQPMMLRRHRLTVLMQTSRVIPLLRLTVENGYGIRRLIPKVIS
jgi:hypothetical protein